MGFVITGNSEEFGSIKLDIKKQLLGKSVKKMNQFPVGKCESVNYGSFSRSTGKFISLK